MDWCPFLAAGLKSIVHTPSESATAWEHGEAKHASTSRTMRIGGGSGGTRGGDSRQIREASRIVSLGTDGRSIGHLDRGLRAPARSSESLGPDGPRDKKPR